MKTSNAWEDNCRAFNCFLSIPQLIYNSLQKNNSFKHTKFHMQLCAVDNGQTIFAPYAEKGKDYTCPLCQGTVRLRGGRTRQLHFFHPNPRITCAHHKKSALHLQVQLHFKKLFPDAQLEHYFSIINRFADVVIPSKKLVFEVQCSPISLFEVRARQKAYLQTGYQLVWILHEKTFNKRFLSDAESYLRKYPSYFTNIDQRGKGWIYDQHELISDVKRFYIGKKIPICLTQYYNLKQDMFKKVPQSLKAKTAHWPLFFKNDLLYRLWQDPNFAEMITKLEKRGKRFKIKKIFRKLLGLHDRALKNALLRSAENS